MDPAQRKATRLLAQLRNPLYSLPRWGRVHHQALGKFAEYDPGALTHQMQQSVLTYHANPPKNDQGFNYWLTVLTCRQSGKSTTGEYAAYPIAGFTPGHDHVCIADTKDRADYLHNRVHGLHMGWTGPIKAKTVPVRESRQLTFDPMTGGKMRTLSAESPAVGIGQSPDSFHASECPFWSDFSHTMSFIYPSIRNRKEVRVLFEATPWTAGSAWHEHWRDAFSRRGRHMGLFFPFWDTKLNVRRWPRGSSFDLEEIRLLEKYGDLGLTKENLAFRREVMDDDRQIRHRPEMFDIYYPFDPVRCWIVPSGGAIPKPIIERMRTMDLEPWHPPAAMYKEPRPGAQYVVAVDPAGFGARDHAAVHVFEVWAHRWEQVATWAGIIDPPELWKVVERLCTQYNRALLVIERNGVGAGLISMAIASGYMNLYYEAPGKPGVWTSDTSGQQMLAWLTEAIDRKLLVLHDADLVDQCATYQNDKIVERTAKSAMLASAKRSDTRRDRHHWDKVSALLMAIVGCREMPARYEPGGKRYEPGEVVLMPGLTWREVEERRKQEEATKLSQANPWRTRNAGVYRSKRRF
ncbi:hypothetical protein CMI37_21425 [Candidatus Pacearchaeota archaeon]|nr:hypothetical protein [Candidatus Pacearchaeota archaeon]